MISLLIYMYIYNIIDNFERQRVPPHEAERSSDVIQTNSEGKQKQLG